MSNFNKHVKSDKIKWIATGIALLFISLIIVGVCLQVFGKGKVKPSEWFKKDETKTEQTDRRISRAHSHAEREQKRNET